MPTMLRERIVRVDHGKWYPSSACGGPPVSLRDLIAKTVRDPGCGHRYFSWPGEFGGGESFFVFMTDPWFDSFESDVCSYDDAFDVSSQTLAAPATMSSTAGPRESSTAQMRRTDVATVSHRRRSESRRGRGR